MKVPKYPCQNISLHYPSIRCCRVTTKRTLGRETCVDAESILRGHWPFMFEIWFCRGEMWGSATFTAVMYLLSAGVQVHVFIFYYKWKTWYVKSNWMVGMKTNFNNSTVVYPKHVTHLQWFCDFTKDTEYLCKACDGFLPTVCYNDLRGGRQTSRIGHCWRRRCFLIRHSRQNIVYTAHATLTDWLR